MKRKLLVAFAAVIAALICVLGAGACTVRENEPSGDDPNTPVIPDKPDTPDTPDDPEKPKEQYTVIFDANGGKFADGAATVTRTVDEGSTLTEPDAPARTASALGGWSISASGGTLWNFASDKITGATTLYAVWNEQPAAIISADGATIDEDNLKILMLVENGTDSVSLAGRIVCSADSVWRLYYDKMGLIEIPTKIAVQKSGELDNGDNLFYIVVTSQNGSEVNVYELNVHRRYQISVSYYDFDGELLTQENLTSGNEYAAEYTPKITGYQFNFWKDGDGNGFTAGVLYAPLELYADCTAKTYIVRLNPDGGEVSEGTQAEVTYGQPFTLPVPQRAGYAFTGWRLYTGTMSSPQITDENGCGLKEWDYDSEQRLVARWSANEYAVTVKTPDDGGCEVTGGGAHKYNSTVNLRARIKSGFIWIGWSDAQNNILTTETDYSFTMGFDATFVAKWIPCPVIIETTKTSYCSVSGLSETHRAGQETMVTAEGSYYTWVGWFKGDELLTRETTYTFIMPSTTEDGFTLTAKWIKRTRVTTGNSGGGSVNNFPDNTVAGQKVTIFTVPTNKIGYTWRGWFAGNEKITDEYEYTFNIPDEEENVKDYVAVWHVIPQLEIFEFESTETECKITGLKQYDVKEIVVPDIVTEIASGAFANYKCNYNLITDLTLPFVGFKVADITYPLGYIFSSGSSSGSVEQRDSEGTPKRYNLPYKLNTIKITGGEICDYAFENCKQINSVQLGNKITSIGNYAFSECTNLTNITLPTELISIGDGAFKNTIIENITLPATITAIGSSAFEGCWKLNDIVIPAGITSINPSTFKSCSNFTSVTIPAGVTSIGLTAFEGCSKITNINLPEGLISIDAYAFSWCSALEEIIIPASVTSIGHRAFQQCQKLKNFAFPAGVTSIADSIFYGCCGLTEVILPEGVTTIYGSAFEGCWSLKHINLPSTLTTIGTLAFYECSGLTDIAIPASVTEIRSSAFSGCPNLNVTFAGTMEQWNKINKNCGVSNAVHCTNGDVV